MSLRSLLVLLFDLSACVLAWVGGFWLRFNFDWWPDFTDSALIGLACLLPAHALICQIAGLYRGLWIFASLPDLLRVAKAVIGSTAALLLFMVLFRADYPVPRSLLALYPLLLAFLMGGGRMAYRLWKELCLFGALSAQGKPVLIIGAGRAAAMLIRELERSPDWRLVGLLDDDPKKWGRELAGYRILGGTEKLAEAAREFKVQHIILAIPSAPAEVRRRIAERGNAAGLHLLTVPALADMLAGSLAMHQIRKVEIEDLLGREAVQIDTAHVSALLKDKVILVTGAGGSIGSELCRQLASFQPRQLLLFEQSEFALYSIEQWFRQYRPEISILPLAGDIKDAVRLDEVFRQHRPQIVFHAAAYKHVPLMEIDNAWQAVRNNALGTLRVARAAQAHAAERFVMISTDKAVNPTNVMGATKRLAEMLCQSLAHAQPDSTRFEIVRFGNVLGSAGSVIPKFEEQIARGGPVTVTHPEITRYFMSIPEAALLVLQASAMGDGSDIFVLDMGAPVRIVDLARNMIRLSGYQEEQIRIEFTGLRPGEKLYEELLADAEATRSTPHPKLRIARSREVDGALLAEVEAWLNQTHPLPDERVRERLQHWIPEYTPNPSGTHQPSASTAA